MFNPTFSSRSGTETLPSVEAMVMVLPEEDGTNSFDKSTLIVRMFPSTVICTFFIRRSPAGEYLPRAPVKFLWEQLSSPTCSRGSRQGQQGDGAVLVFDDPLISGGDPRSLPRPNVPLRCPVGADSPGRNRLVRTSPYPDGTRHCCVGSASHSSRDGFTRRTPKPHT